VFSFGGVRLPIFKYVFWPKIADLLDFSAHRLLHFWNFSYLQVRHAPHAWRIRNPVTCQHPPSWFDDFPDVPRMSRRFIYIACGSRPGWSGWAVLALPFFCLHNFTPPNWGGGAPKGPRAQVGGPKIWLFAENPLFFQGLFGPRECPSPEGAWPPNRFGRVNHWLDWARNHRGCFSTLSWEGVSNQKKTN